MFWEGARRNRRCKRIRDYRMRLTTFVNFNFLFNFNEIRKFSSFKHLGKFSKWGKERERVTGTAHILQVVQNKKFNFLLHLLIDIEKC